MYKGKAVAWYFRAAAFCIGEKISKDGLSMAHEGVATELTIIDVYDKKSKKILAERNPEKYLCVFVRDAIKPHKY